MNRRLQRRVERLAQNMEPAAVVNALEDLVAGREPPSSRAGQRAEAIWNESLAIPHPVARRLWCRLQATGETLADLVREAHNRRLSATSK